MSTATSITIAGINPMYVHRLDVSTVRRMQQIGILRDGEPIELIEGLLIRKDRSDTGGNPLNHGPHHALAVRRLQTLVPRLSPHGFELLIQLPISLSSISEPEPDGAIVRTGAGFDGENHPSPADIAAVIEVADSSLRYDRLAKQKLYATAAIPTYWIVNIPERKLEVYRSPDPTTGKYTQRNDFVSGETVQLDLGAGRQLDVAVAEILG